MGFFRKLFQSLFKKVEEKYKSVTPVPELKDPVVATTPKDPIPATIEAGKLGTTADSWSPPAAPWPIDARYLSSAQVAKLNAEETGRANMWRQALITSGATGNGQNPVPSALMIFRMGYGTKFSDSIWEPIFKAYNVPFQVKKEKTIDGVYEWTGDYDPASVWKKPGDLGYPTRDAMYAGRVPWLYKREREKQLKESGFNADHPYKTVDEKDA